jgi:LacI family transcriptional regulator, galactose operon repressor
MPTIYDVAQKAGVAPITVSRVINQRGYFSEKTRDRVERAIAELGYVPNRLASGLRSKRTNLLALVLTDITNPFFTMIARGVEDAASDAGYTVIFCNTDESLVEEQKYIQILLENQVEGVLLVPSGGESKSVEQLKHNGTQVVVLDRSLVNTKVDIVRSDSVLGSIQLTNHLLELGHRRIAHLGGPAGVSTAVDRLEGFNRALDEAGIPNADRLIFRGSFTQDSGHKMALQALRHTPTPTAMFAANNFIAIGALNALRESNLRVPEDIALVGFDDLPPSLVTFPFFTVVAQSAYEMGRIATGILLKRLTEDGLDQPEEIVLPTELIIRQSSGDFLKPGGQDQVLILNKGQIK